MRAVPLSLNPFARAAAQTVADALGVDAADLPVTLPPRPELGDFAVGCFPAARALKQAPPALAARVAAGFSPGPLLAAATAAGPFVNFRADRGALYRSLFRAALVDGALIPRDVAAGRTVIVDYSSPNISKHLAYHHIRSTVIGHALCNLHRALGARVVGVNHLGDWGTTHGQLIAAYKKWGAPEPLDITALNDLYVRFQTQAKEDESLREEGKAWFARLEQGDAEARGLWQRFRDVSLAEFDEVYRELGIVFEDVRGESDFVDDMPAVLDMLEQKGLSGISEGALVVPLDDLGIPPLLLRKQDGATLYATRDLAAAMYRWRTFQFDRALYVVDRGQSLHFKQLFATLARAGFEWASRCEHVPFGLVRIGGKKTGTRTGNVVLLREVLREAAERSRDRVRDKNPDMSEAELAGTARVVGSAPSCSPTSSPSATRTSTSTGTTCCPPTATPGRTCSTPTPAARACWSRPGRSAWRSWPRPIRRRSTATSSGPWPARWSTSRTWWPRRPIRASRTWSAATCSTSAPPTRAGTPPATPTRRCACCRPIRPRAAPAWRSWPRRARPCARAWRSSAWARRTRCSSRAGPIPAAQ